MARTLSKLPLTPRRASWVSFRPSRLTEEVFRCHFAEKSKKTVSQRTSPDLASLGHPPQRGGQERFKHQFDDQLTKPDSGNYDTMAQGWIRCLKESGIRGVHDNDPGDAC